MNVAFAGWSLGTLIAIVVLVLVIVLAATGQITALMAGILGGLALSRLC